MARRAADASGIEATLDEDAALRKIVEGVEAQTGEGFFRSLVRCVTEALGVAYAFVSELDAEREVFRTLAVWGHGHLLDNFELPIAGTPCEGVLHGEMAHYADHVQQRFPQDVGLKTWEAESYCGVPLVDSQGAVLGHLAIFDTKPMRDPRGLSILRIFASRARAELERRARSSRCFARARGAIATSTRKLRSPTGTRTYEGGSTSANRAMAEMFGYPLEEIVGRTLSTSAPTPRAANRRHLRCAAIPRRGTEIRGDEVEGRHADGSPLWIQSR